MLVGVFECGVCFHEFDSRLKRPVIGHCGHTICEQCSQGVRQYNFGHCPLCQSRNSMLTASKDGLLNLIRGQAPCSECVEPLQTKPHCEMCHHNGSPLNCNHTRIELPKLSTAKLLHQINIFKDHDLMINRQYEINYENMKKQCEELQLEQGLAIRAHSLMLNEEETMMREKQMQLKRIQISTPTEDELEIIRIELRKIKEQNDSFAQEHELQTANKVACSSCKFMTRLETLRICLHCRRNASVFRKNPKNDSLEIIDQEKALRVATCAGCSLNHLDKRKKHRQIKLISQMLISMFNSALAPFLDNLSGSEQDRATKTAIDFLKKKCSEAKSLEDGQTFVEQAKLVASLNEAPKEPKPSPMPRSSGSSRRKQPSQNIRQSQTSINTLDDSIIII